MSAITAAKIANRAQKVASDGCNKKGKWMCKCSVYANEKGGGHRGRMNIGTAYGYGKNKDQAYEDMVRNAMMMVTYSGYSGRAYVPTKGQADCRKL